MEREARILSINISETKGTGKKPIKEAFVIKNFGIKGDAHASRNSKRQVSLLSIQSINKIKNSQIDIKHGDFGENITLDYTDLYRLPIGTLLYFQNGVIMKISQIGKKCHTGCNIFKTIGKCIIPAEGIFAIVLKSGKIKKNEVIRIKYE